MVVAALMVLLLGLVILLLRRVIQADQPNATTDLGFFAYKAEKDHPNKGKADA